MISNQMTWSKMTVIILLITAVIYHFHIDILVYTSCKSQAITNKTDCLREKVQS